jgi:hypothetical protein
MMKAKAKAPEILVGHTIFFVHKLLDGGTSMPKHAGVGI